MLKRALIIRSASFQQLDRNLPEIQQQMPGYVFDLLTHEHGVKLAEKYEGINKIIPYSYKQSFNRKLKVNGLPSKPYDAVIYVVTNMTGVGFWNVLQFAFTIPANHYIQCNMHTELKTMTKAQFYKGVFFKWMQRFISLITTGLCSILVIPYLFFKFFQIRSELSEE
ncbi:hypothetical protein ACFSTH_19350 [Paenibacillus yanchengensis]|uniref:DUF2812 domain-containing protein n=1 Tax=Paenibacillus yanchengensis TaxID=2035833 RepID=A0ABW4YMK4_9BACL